MIFFVNAQGDAMQVTPSSVYQGSNNASEIVLIAAISQSASVAAQFVLPNGIETQPFVLTPSFEFGFNGLGVWRTNLSQSITQYSGQASVSFMFVVAGEAPTTYRATFAIQRGYTDIGEEPPTNATYAKVLEAINNLSNQLADVSNGFLKSVVLDGTWLRFTVSRGEQQDILSVDLDPIKVDVVDTAGYSDAVVMSQKAVTECLNDNGINYNLTGLFELGTVYVISGTDTIRYENSTNTIRVKRDEPLYLNAGDVISTDELAEFRLVRTDAGFVTMEPYLSTFTITASGYYTMAVRKKDASTVDDVAALLSSLTISNSQSKISMKISKIEEETSALSSDVLENSWRVKVNSDQFEFGTAYQSGSGINYESNTNCVRTKRGTGIDLVAGSTVVLNGIQVRVIYAEEGEVQTITNYTSDEVSLPLDGKYVFVFKYADNRDISSIEEVLALFTIENGANPLVLELSKQGERISALENKGVKVDNSAKGVFAVMSYNAGRWYNGSGSKVPAADFENYLELQESILGRYDPDVLCLQEYSDEISAGESAIDLLIKERYHFYPNALGTSSYDGKAICTNRSLSGAENILFETTEGALTRNYEKAYIYMNGRKVCVISAHLSQGQAECASNIQQILEDIAGETYVIICADTNVDAADPSSAKYQATLKQFTDAGYVLANDGSLKTYPQLQTAIDNIIVSSNIIVKSAIVDTQKEPLGAYADHYPLIAYLEIF